MACTHEDKTRTTQHSKAPNLYHLYNPNPPRALKNTCPQKRGKKMCKYTKTLLVLKKRSFQPWIPAAKSKNYYSCTVIFKTKCPAEKYETVIFALLLQLHPFRNSDPGSRNGHSSPLPATVHASCLLREEFSMFSPSSTRVDLCIHTLLMGAFCSQFFHKKKNRPRGGLRTREIGLSRCGAFTTRSPGRLKCECVYLFCTVFLSIFVRTDRCIILYM